MLILQEPWSPASDDPMPSTLRAILKHSGETQPLMLLPLNTDQPATTTSEFCTLIASWARQCDAFIAAASVCRDNSRSTVATLAGPDGTTLIRYVSGSPPDPQTGQFPTADTPDGRVGLLCDQEILSPYRVRSLVFSSAEIILNPSCERSDEELGIRLASRQARAYENLVWVACASPKQVRPGGIEIDLPNATLAADPSGQAIPIAGYASYLQVDVDIDALRSRRQQPMRNFPAIVRCDIYLEDLKAEQELPTNTHEPPAYDVVLCQHVVHQAKSPEELIPNRERNLNDALELIAPIARQPKVRLAVLPEFFITGPVSPLGDQLGHIADQIGIQVPGPEIDCLATFAKEHRVFLAGGVFEFDPEWPQRFFNTAFILDDQGELILRYRKIHCGDVMGFLPDTTPGSVYTEYVKRYGYEALFPVVDTDIGKLAATICFDMNFPETYTALARRGAEVILHPTSEPHNSGRPGWDIARRVRAFENQSYVISCGHGGEYVGGVSVPTSRARGYSKIVDYRGNVQVIADGPGRVALPGSIDLAALRRHRANQQPVTHESLLPAFASAYGKGRGIANDLWRTDPLTNPYRGCREINQVIDRYLGGRGIS